MSNQTRIILHLNDGSDGILALRAARSLMKGGHRSCIYSYENGVSVYAYRTQTGVAAREHRA
jgi:hypothetical protein